MHILKRSLLFVGVAAFALTACKDDDDPVDPPDTIAVTNITVTPPTMNLTVGDVAQLGASVQTNGGTGTVDLGVNWLSQQPTKASVDANGKVTALAAGTTTVTATSKANAAFSASSFITVAAPAQLPNALLSFSVTPSATSVVLGATQATTTITSLSPGATVTFANSSSNPARCTVPATGANPLITTVVGGGAGTCVITIVASGTGAGSVNNQIAQAVAVTVTAQPTALLSLTVSPNQLFMFPSQTQVIQTLTQIAAGANAATFASSSSNPAVATVTATGANPTITAVGNGNAQITITATATGTNLQTNSISAIVDVNVQAAAVSINSLKVCVGGPPCVVTPANLAGVAGQLEVEVTINSGNQSIDSVHVRFSPPGTGGSCTVGTNYVRAQGQIFGVNGAPEQPISLSILTDEFDANFNPKWLNSLQCVQARIFPKLGPVPDASNTFTFQLANPDVVYYNATVGTTGGAPGLQHTGNSAAGPGGTWWKGGFTFRPHPVLYSGAANVVSISYTSSACGVGTAVAAPWAATFSCAAVESNMAGVATAPFQNITNAVGDVFITYVPAYTITASPTAFMTAATPAFKPGNPVYAVVNTLEDNRGPVTHTPTFANAGALFGGGTWTGNGSGGVALFQPAAFQLAAAVVTPATTYNVTATDFGVGGATTPTITETLTSGTTFNSGTTATGVPLVESLTSTQYQNRGNASTDALGNVGLTNGLVSGCGGGTPVATTNRCAVSGLYGVDLAVLDARYADGGYTTVPAAVANPARYQGANGNAGTGAGIFTTLGVAVAPATLWGPINNVTDLIFVDAIDTRSGLNNPAAFFQAVRRFSPAGSANCYTSAVGGDPLTGIQANSYVQNPAGAATSAAIDCTFGAGVPGPGYYTWTGFVADRANNRRKINRAPGNTVVDSIWIAIDGALPNITGIGFQTTLYAGGLPAQYDFSANDDLELKEGQVTLQYLGAAGPCGAPCASGTGVAFLGPLGGVIYPYGTSAYTTAAFGTPFDGTITNVLNAQALTLSYYITRYDVTTLAAFVPGAVPSGNVAGFTSSEIQSNIIANIRDVAYQQAAVPIGPTPILNTQITDRVGGAGGAPGYGAGASGMIDFRIVGVAGGIATVRDAAASSISAPFCDRVDIYEVVSTGVATTGGNTMTANDASIGDVAGDGLRWRQTISNLPVLTDNGFQRFWTYTSSSLALPTGMPAATGFYVAACLKSGSALLSPVF